MFVFFFNIITIFSIFKITIQIDCSLFLTCVSCSINKNCIWENNICSSSNKIILNWYNQFENCKDDINTIKNMNNYCFNSKNRNNNQFDLSSNEYNGNYISESKELFCFCSIDAETNKKTKIKYSSLNFNELNVYNESINGNIIKYQTLIIYFEDYNNFNIVPLTDNYIYETKQISKIEFYFLYIDTSNSISYNFYTKPFFTLTIGSDNKFTTFGIIILITCLLILAVIILVNLIFYNYGFYSNNNENQNERDNKFISIYDKNQINNKKLIEKNLEAKKYNVNQFNEKSNDTCTFCLEEFKENEFIIILPCNHIFHCNCIRKWLEVNLKEPLCPNCKKNIIFELKNLNENDNKNNPEIDSNDNNIIFVNRNSTNQNNLNSPNSNNSNDINDNTN